MRIYWIDSGVLISASKGPYSFDLVPAFWTFVDKHLSDGTIRMPKKCFDEVTDGNDELAKWCKTRRQIGYFRCTADKDTQARYGQIANFVYGKYKPHAAAEFLKGGDGWLVAHALATNGFVVTEELRNKYRSKIKIPILAKELRAPWKATHEMCRELGGFS